MLGSGYQTAGGPAVVTLGEAAAVSRWLLPASRFTGIPKFIERNLATTVVHKGRRLALGERSEFVKAGRVRLPSL